MSLPESLNRFNTERDMEYPWIAEKLRQYGVEEVLDVGTGRGTILEFLPLEQIKIWGTNLDAPEVPDEIEKHRRDDFEQVFLGRVDEIEPDRKWDCIICVSAIEHFGMTQYGRPLDEEEDLRGAEKFYQWLKPGGCLFLTTPFGKPEIYGFRVYDRRRLERLFPHEKWEWVETDFICGGGSHWEECAEEKASRAESARGVSAVIFLGLRKR